jgi:hypothetical protein
MVSTGSLLASWRKHSERLYIPTSQPYPQRVRLRSLFYAAPVYIVHSSTISLLTSSLSQEDFVNQSARYPRRLPSAPAFKQRPERRP